MQRFSKGYKTPLQTLAKGHTQAVHPLRHMHTHTSAGGQARTHTCTHTHTHAPKGKCRYTNISALQPKTVSLCWFFWAPKSGLGAETVPTRFFYAMQQVFWGKERCIQHHLMGTVQSGKWEVKVKMKRRMRLVGKRSEETIKSVRKKQKTKQNKESNKRLQM